MIIRILKTPVDQKAILRELMHLYLHDLSEFTHESPDADGRYEYGAYFDQYWSDPTRHPYLFYRNVLNGCEKRAVNVITY